MITIRKYKGEWIKDLGFIKRESLTKKLINDGYNDIEIDDFFRRRIKSVKRKDNYKNNYIHWKSTKVLENIRNDMNKEIPKYKDVVKETFVNNNIDFKELYPKSFTHKFPKSVEKDAKDMVNKLLKNYYSDIRFWKKWKKSSLYWIYGLSTLAMMNVVLLFLNANVSVNNLSMAFSVIGMVAPSISIGLMISLVQESNRKIKLAKFGIKIHKEFIEENFGK